jgi:2-keto-3-deoxy-L-rhamnonate aldolase RhmA
MNPFQLLLRSSARSTAIGTWIVSASPLVAEAVGHAGFDWGVIDMEHTPADLMHVTQMLQAVGNTKMVPVVRVPGNDAVLVKRVLDAGAFTIMFPNVQTPLEARDAVAATRYPPHGRRGVAPLSRATHYGMDDDALAAANRRVGVVVELESAAALREAPAIAAVDDVDAVFIGPRDLAASMGHLGQSMHPAVLDAMAQAARAIKAAGKPVGTIGDTPEVVATYRAAGFDFVAICSDMGLLMRGARNVVQMLRQQKSAAHVHTLADGTRTEATA